MRTVIHNGLIIFVLILSEITAAQEPDPEKSIETIIESIVDGLEDDIDASIVLEDLQYLAEKPLNLNDANEDELRKLYFLNTHMIKNLIEYRNKYGQIYSLGELIAVEGFSNEIIQKLSPFVTTEPSKNQQVSIRDAFRYNDHRLLFRMSRVVQQPKGYLMKEDRTIPYLGDQNRYYMRYNIVNDRFTGGFIAEKDPGEVFFKGSNKQGFDFYSFYASYTVNKLIENIIAGDFIIRSGQGLIAWQGYSPGKSVDVLNISRTGQGIRPCTTTEENRFFRGISTTLNLKKVNLQLFFSSKKEDANLETSDTGNIHFTSLQTSGYHRTVPERADEKAVRHTNTGVLAWLNLQNLKIGTTFLYEKFEYPFIRTPQPYNLFYFNGTENINFGIDYQYYYRRFSFFGEAARSKSGGNAFVQGLIAHPDDRINFAFLLRHFDRNHQSVWGNAFSEGTMVSNETGFYTAVRILPVKKITISAYSDFYKFPWITYSTIAPSSGRDFQIQADIKLRSSVQFYLRFKNEEKEMKSIVNERYVNIPEKLQRYRFHAEYKISPELKIRNRFELCAYSGKTTESGIMLFHDLVYSPRKVPLNAVFRAAWFNTGSYNTAIYAYENDVLYSFSIPAYYGKGFRFFVNLRYRIMSCLDFWFRTGHSIYQGKESVGTGNDEINGNMKTDIKFQLRLTI